MNVDTDIHHSMIEDKTIKEILRELEYFYCKASYGNGNYIRDNKSAKIEWNDFTYVCKLFDVLACKLDISMELKFS